MLVAAGLLAAAAAPSSMLDVTAAPYSADPTGASDSTAALQKAVDDGYARRVGVFIPGGRYVVSGQIKASQTDCLGPGDGGINIVPCRFHSHVIVGEKGSQRPVIALAANATGFDNPSKPKAVWRMENPHNGNVNMNQVLRGIDFDLGSNPGAVGVWFHGAQGCAAQDISVQATGAYAGFSALCGAGGSHTNIAVVGGEYGVYAGESEPVPVIAAARFVNQTKSAVMWKGQQTLVMVGVEVEMAGGRAAVQAYSTVSVVDSVFTCNGCGTEAINADASVYLRNVWTNSGRVVVQNGHTTLAGSDAGVSVSEFAKGVNVDNLVFDVTVVNGVRTAGGNVTAAAPGAAPAPGAVVAEHTWSEQSFPSVSDGSAVDARADCGVKGDNVTDDADALQACLDKHAAVYLPKGYYRLSKTINLTNSRALLGVSQTHSVLMPLSAGLQGSGMRPVLRTDRSAVTLAFVGVMTWWHVADVRTLEWESHGGLYRSNYESRVGECLWWNDYTTLEGAPPCAKAVNLTGPKTVIRGTGRFYNYASDEDIVFTSDREYRHLLIADNAATATDRLRLYSLNVEHVQAQANLEIRNSSAVDMYGLKAEGSNVIAWIRDSADVSMYGYGGSQDAYPSNSERQYYPADFDMYPPSLFRLERSTYRLLNLNDPGWNHRTHGTVSPVGAFPLTPAVVGVYPWPDFLVDQIVKAMWAPWPGYQVPRGTWNLIAECDGVNTSALSPPFDRPVYYARTQ